MALTKPAGAFLQVLGALCLFGGLLVTTRSVIGGLVTMAIGGWLLYVGRQPLIKRGGP